LSVCPKTGGETDELARGREGGREGGRMEGRGKWEEERLKFN